MNLKRTPLRATGRGWSSMAAAAAVTASVTLSGCGTTASSGSAPSAGAGKVPAGVTSSVTKALAKVTTFPGPTAPVNAPSGKRLMILECGSSGTGCVLGANGAKAAAAKLGWSAQIVDGKLDPTAWNQAIEQAVADKVDGIVITAINPVLVTNGLAQAKAAGIPVVDVYQPEYPGAPVVTAYLTSDHTAGGKIAADWAVSDSKAKADVLLLDLPEYPETVERNNALVAELKAQCPGCKVTRQQFSGPQMATTLASQVTGSLSQNSSINYVWVPVDAAAPFVQQGIQQAGKTSSVKMFSAEGDPTASDRIRTGAQAADVVTPDDYMGWLSIDTLARTFAKVSFPQVQVVPQRLLTKANIGDMPVKGTWDLNGVDYASQFAKLWGK